MRAQVVYVLSMEPLVVTGSFASYVAMARVKRPFTFLYHNPGWIRLRSLPRYLKLIRHFGPNARLHFITNEESEKRWLQLIGQKATCLGHNLHVRENFFVPGDVPKKYDAVYAATMAPYKRIELAREIQKLCFVTYVTHQKTWNLHEFEPRLRHAVYNSEFISREAVRLCYQQSAAGLALSASEGAMFSCMEYLLCGIPVVTTPNRGGRSRYLDENNSIFVPPNSTAIRKAVDLFVNDPPDPSVVRNSALQKAYQDRLRFVDILASYGGTIQSDADNEIERIWGGVEGIEKHAVSVSQLKQTLG